MANLTAPTENDMVQHRVAAIREGAASAMRNHGDVIDIPMVGFALLGGDMAIPAVFFNATDSRIIRERNNSASQALRGEVNFP